MSVILRLNWRIASAGGTSDTNGVCGVDPALQFSKGMKTAFRVAFTALALLIGFSAVCASSASAAIVHPANGSNQAASPLDFHGDASLSPGVFATDVSLILFNEDENGLFTISGVGSGPLDINGDWNIQTADLTLRADAVTNAPLPDGTPLQDGKYRLRITQSSVDLLTSDNVWLSDFRVDTVAPDTSIDSATPASPANVPVRTFTFSSANPFPGSAVTFECRIDGGAWFTAGCTSGYSTPNLADGNHTFDVRAVDAAGNIDATPATSNWFVDTTPPNTLIDSATPASPTNIGVRTLTFHGVDPAPASPPVSLECRLDGGAWFTVDCDGDYTTANLPEGNHTFNVRATDALGNVDPTPATSTWMIDQTDPTINIVSPGVRQRFVMGSGSKSYSCADPLHGGPPLVASGIQSCTDHGFSTAHLGNFRFQVDARDKAGNTSTDARAYAVDPPRYADLVNPRNPIAYYRLGDPLGSVPMADSSGNGRNGEFKNGIALRRPPAPNCHVRPHAPYTCDLTSDPQDWSAFFPARDGYGFTNNITAPQTAYTIEGWINRADAGDGSIMGQGGGGQLFVKNGKLALRQTQDTVYASGPTLTPGQWFHVAATWNGSLTRLYVNGQQVGSSSSANKPPSGSSTLYVGYGDQAPWFHGSLDEMAYYGTALPGSAFAARYEVGTAHDVPSPAPNGPPIQRPSADIDSPNNNGLYAVTKLPPLDFHCEDLDGNATVATCTATVDGNPILDGANLPDTPGAHTVVVTAVDNDGLTRSHTHTYTIKSFEDIYNDDAPLAYYRLGDMTNGPMKDSGPSHRDGIYKNAQESGPVGISGDGDHARRFFGSSGYGYVNNITAPTTGSTIEAWVNPDDLREQSIVGHGDAGEIFIDTDGVLSFRHMGTTVRTSPAPAPGRFTQVVGVWDGVNIYLYVDGELRATAEATKRPSSVSTFYVGYGEIKPWFKGSLDEVAYYGKALTPNRILEHFLADPPPPDSTFVNPGDPGTPGDPTTPVDPDRPVSPDDPLPVDPNPPVDDQPTNPDDPAIYESGSGTNAGAKGRKSALKKCQKIKKKSKRKNCVKRVNRSFR